MENIKNHLSTYLKSTTKATDYDINHNVLSLYLDSLDIVDMVFEIERYYKINTKDDWTDWENCTLDNVVEYIKSKL